MKCLSFSVPMCSSRAALRRTDVKEDRVRSRIRLSRFALVFVALLIALLPAIANAQAIVKVNDNVNFRLGILLQGWADWSGQSNAVGDTAGFQQNLFRAEERRVGEERR